MPLKLTPRKRDQSDKNQQHTHHCIARNPLTQEMPGNKRPPEDVGFLHWNRYGDAANTDGEIIEKQSKRRDNACPNKRQNRTAPDIPGRSGAQLVQRVMFPNQKDAQKQTRQAPEKGPDKGVGVDDAKAVEDVGRGIAQHRACSPWLAAATGIPAGCINHSVRRIALESEMKRPMIIAE